MCGVRAFTVWIFVCVPSISKIRNTSKTSLTDMVMRRNKGVHWSSHVIDVFDAVFIVFAAIAAWMSRLIMRLLFLFLSFLLRILVTAVQLRITFELASQNDCMGWFDFFSFIMWSNCAYVSMKLFPIDVLSYYIGRFAENFFHKVT